MKNPDAGQLIAESTAPKTHTGKGRAYNDRTGEKRMMSCGQIATIIAYRSNSDLDIQFEDGAIATNRTYVAFEQGYIKHPNHELSGLNKYQTSFRDERIGESKIMNNGLKATIIDYNGRYKVTIQFEDGVILKDIHYSSFKKGEATHPTVKTPRKRRAKIDALKGIEGTMTNGMKATIIASRGSNDIDVQFEDGAIAEHRTYNAFRAGNIAHPNKFTSRIGETKVMNNGMECTLIAYRAHSDIDVRFADGTEVYNRNYAAFQQGSILNPSLSKIGKKAKSKSPQTNNAEPSDSTQEQVALDSINAPRTLLFEAAIYYNQGPSYFYYVEQHGENYYFEHGLSMTGVPIHKKEINRLNIITFTKEQYDAFKEELLSNAKQTRWYGAGYSYRAHFTFLDEAVTEGTDIDIPRFAKPFHLIMNAHFEVPFISLRRDVTRGVLIDQFEMCNALFTVIHDKKYQPLPKEEPTEFDTRSDTQILIDFLRMAPKDNIHKDILQTKTARREQYDLMREALYIQIFKKYPQQMIVVHGWTAKDLIECRRCDYIEAYNYLTLLRTEPAAGKEQLKEIFGKEFAKLFQEREGEGILFDSVCF